MTEEIIAALRSLDLSDGGSHLSAIASCFYQPTFGWTGGACEILRDLLIEILEGKDVDDDNDHAHAHGCDYGHHRCDQRQMSYDVLSNERHKAVCELRKVCTKLDESVWTWIEDVAIAIGAQDNQSDEYESMLPKITDRLIHLLGGDQPTLSDLYGIWQDGEESENKGSESARKMTKSAEIGEFNEHVRQLEHDVEMWRDRAEDMRMERDDACAECDNLQSAIDEMASEIDSARAKNRRLTWHIDQMQGGSRKWREQFETMKAERDELQAKLDDYDETHVALPKDEDGEYIHVGDVMDGYAKTIEVVELRIGRSGWVIVSRDGNAYADTYAFTHHHKPTVEQVIRDLTLGKITESQAIERIEGIHGQG